MSDTMTGKTYYEILGVPTDATTEEITAAYRERLKETHPDVSDDTDASSRTKQLIEAKDVLTDDTERARYDRLGHEQYVDRTAAPDRGHPGERVWTDRERTHETTASPEAGTHDPSARDTRATTGRADTAENTASTSWYSGNTREAVDGDTPGGAWRAWNTNKSYAVTGREEGLHGSRLFPPGQSTVLLATTFLLYPVLLVGALAPPFPPVVNVVLGGCLLGVVVYLQTLPEAGIIIFGAWALLLPAILWGLPGVPLVAVPGGIALVGTVLPLGLSLLTRAVIRP